MTETQGQETDPGKKSALALVVDDDPKILELVDEILKDGGHNTWKVTTITDALSFLQKKEFDLAILDIYLPDGTGLELAGKKQDRVLLAQEIDDRQATGRPGNAQGASSCRSRSRRP